MGTLVHRTPNISIPYNNWGDGRSSNRAPNISILYINGGDQYRDIYMLTHEKINGHRELTVSSRWPRWSRLRGPMITAQSRLGEVTAQSRRGHSSVTPRSQLSHGEVTAQSRHLQYDHGSVTARSQLNHGPGHSSVTAGCDHFGHRELTVSSRWTHGELTVSSHGGQFFFHGKTICVVIHFMPKFDLYANCIDLLKLESLVNSFHCFIAHENTWTSVLLAQG